MPLTDLLKPQSPAPAAPVDRPAGITCEKYVPGEGKRCVSYVDNGACSRPDEFMCVEWMKRNANKTDGTAPQKAIVAVPPTLKEGQLLTRDDVESFKKLGVEVELKSPLGTFWLVPVRTGKERMELTVEEAVTLANVVHVFGGRIASLTRDGKPLPDADPAALAATEELAVATPPPDPTPDDARAHLRRLREQATPAPSQPEPPAQTSLFANDKDSTR